MISEDELITSLSTLELEHMSLIIIGEVEDV